MDERILKFRVGIFVVIAMLILGILIFVNSEGWKPKYTVYIKSFSAPGVTVGTPIRKNGILIGRVSDVLSQDDGVVLELAINYDDRVYENETCSIGSQSFLGDAVVEILPLLTEERGNVIPRDGNGQLERVAVRRNPMEVVDVAINLESEITETLKVVQSAGRRIEDAGTSFDELSTTVQAVLNDDESEIMSLVKELRSTINRAEPAIDNFTRLFESANDLVGDPQLQGDIRETIETLPEIFEEVRSTVAETRNTINSFQSVSGKANTNLENLEAFTAALKSDGPEILTQVRDSLENVDGLVSGIRDFTDSFAKLQESEGTIGKLLNDTEVYDNVLETVENVKELSSRLEPLMDDLRSFADILARDPGIVGVRGAMDRRPGKTGYKGTAGRDGGFFDFR